MKTYYSFQLKAKCKASLICVYTVILYSDYVCKSSNFKLKKKSCACYTYMLNLKLFNKYNA